MKSFVLSFLILSSLFSFAQTPTWKNITPPGWSGTFKTVTFSKGGRAIAASNNGWIYQSTDTGKTWQTVYYGCWGNTISPTITFSSDSLHGVYVGVHDSTPTNRTIVAYTADGGQTWQKSQTVFNNTISAGGVYWKTKDSVFVGIFNENTWQMYIYMSTNGGKSWAQTSGLLSTNGADLQIYFPTPLHGYAFSSYYYGETTDGGNTWTPISYTGVGIQSSLKFANGQMLFTVTTAPQTTFPNCRFSTIVSDQLADLGNGKIYNVEDGSIAEQTVVYSTDSGKTWTNHVIAPTSYSGSLFLYGVAFLNAKVGVAVGNNLSSFVTTDGGTTWTKYIHGGAEGFNNIYFKNKNEGWITGNTGRLFHTADGGTTWDYQDLFKTSLQQVVFPTPDTGYVSANGAIFRTTDTTANGERIWTRFTQTNSGGFLSFPTKDTGYVGFPNGGGTVDKTTDAGQTWNTAADYTFVTNVGIYGSTACFRSTTEGLVSGSNGNLLYTNNGGSSWKSIPLDMGGYGANAIIDLNGRDWIIMSGYGQVYKCDKNINCTLKYFDNPNNYTYLNGYKQDTNSIYIETEYDTLVVTHDGGNTWQRTKDNLFGRVSFPVSTVCYSTFSTVIYKKIYQDSLKITSLKNTGANNYTMTLNFTETEINATVSLVNDVGTVYNLNNNIVIENGVPFSITIPTTTPVGDYYKIKITPFDTLSYTSVESTPIIVTNTLIVPISNKNYTVKGNQLIVYDEKMELYTILGQQLQSLYESSISLPAGIYLLKTAEGTQKIVITK